jgi:putative tricarboxylic transport membrane protein
MELNKIPLAPFVVGFVLGPIAEENLAAGLMGRVGVICLSLRGLYQLLFILISLPLLAVPLIRRYRANLTVSEDT